MSDPRIKPITMPKWGLSMKEGKLAGWLVQPGAKLKAGDEIMEIETDKIANVVQAAEDGTLRRVVGETDAMYPVKALLGVIADDSVSDGDIDAFVAGYVAPAGGGDDDEGASAYAFVALPEGRIRYAKRGEGENAVIFIHGFGGDADNWLFNIDAPAKSGSVYALDLPGHGESVKRLPEPTLAGLAKTVAAFMDALHIDSAHLVGHSLGGAIAMRLALDAPKRVNSLTLIGSAGLGPEINSGYLGGFVSASSRRDLKPVVELLFANQELVSRQLIDNLLRAKRIDGVEATLHSLAASVFPGGKQGSILAAEIAKSGKPIQVIWGREDQIIPVSHAAALGSTAKSEVIDGAGHMVQMEAAAKVNVLIEAFVGAAHS